MADKKKQKTGPMRLDKFLGEMGYGTRTQIKEMVRKGRVQVNGQVIKAPESKLAPETDQVMVDQALVGYARMEYYMPVSYTHLDVYKRQSSSIVKEIAEYDGDISEFLHPAIAARVREKLRDGR